MPAPPDVPECDQDDPIYQQIDDYNQNLYDRWQDALEDVTDDQLNLQEWLSQFQTDIYKADEAQFRVVAATQDAIAQGWVTYLQVDAGLAVIYFLARFDPELGPIAAWCAS